MKTDYLPRTHEPVVEPSPEYHYDPPVSRKIIYQEICEEDDLVEMFALRSLVYQYVNFFTRTDNGHMAHNILDIDCYDPYSTFLGAFECTRKSKRLIGSVRIISGDTESPIAPVVRTIYRSTQGNDSPGLPRRQNPFPHVETFNGLAPLYREYFADNGPSDEENGRSVNKPYEISRLVLLPEYWKTKERVELGLHIMIILSSWKARPVRNKFIIAVHPRSRRLYERLGFSALPELKEKIYKGINQPAILMRLDLQAYLKKPNPYIKICSSAYDDFLRDGYFTKQ